MNSTSIPTKSQPPSSSSAPVSVACEKCQHENPATRRFCSSCGDPLWRACPTCGEENAAAEVFCGHCGENLLQLLEQSRDAITAALERAEQLAEEHRYDAAIAHLRLHRKTSDSRLHALVGTVQQRIEHLRKLSEQGSVTATSAIETAESQLADHAYADALATLKSIPQPLHDDNFRALLAKTTDLQNQVRKLNDEMRSAVAANQLDELALVVDQLLTLQPNHKQARQLALQLGERFRKKAERRLAEHRYADALEVLSHTPAIARNGEFEKIRCHVAELKCLQDDLQFAAVVDPTVQSIADRLVELAPNNEHAAQLRVQVQSRAQQPTKSTRCDKPNWFVPKGGRFADSVDWWARPTCLRFEGETSKEFSTKPGRFTVAIGLALQGLDVAHISTNLLPEEFRPKRRLGNLTLLRKKSTTQSAWGIDVGSSSLKAVRMVRDTSDDTITVTETVLIDYSKFTGANEREAWRTVVPQALQELCDGRDLQAGRTVVGVVGQQVLGRFFTLPPMEIKRRKDAIAFEARSSIPFPMDEVVWDYHIFDEPDESGDNDNRPCRVMVVAAKSHHLNETLTLCKEVGLNVDVLQCDCVALHNAAQFEFFRDAAESTPNGQLVIGVVDVGGQSTNVLASWSNGLWFRSFGVGGDNFSQAIVREFKLTRQQAETIKRQPTRIKRLSAYYAALDPEFESWFREMERSIEAFQKIFPDDRLQHLYGVGGGFQLHGLLRRLRNP